MLNPEPSPQPNDLVCVGKIGKAIGLKGWLNFWPSHSQPVRLHAVNLWIKLASPETVFNAITLEKFDLAGQKILFQSVRNREQAQSLNHATLWVKRAELALHFEHEVCGEELIGMQIFGLESVEPLGTIVNLIPTPAYHLLEIVFSKNSTENKKASSQFLPYIPDISIASIDRARQNVWITPLALEWLE